MAKHISRGCCRLMVIEHRPGLVLRGREVDMGSTLIIERRRSRCLASVFDDSLASDL